MSKLHLITRNKLRLPRQNGFTFVEVLLLIAIAVSLSLGMISLFRLGLLSGKKTSNLLQAKMLAKEAMEAVITIRDAGGANWNWTTTPANTNASEYYQPSITSNNWVLGSKLSATPPPVLSVPFDRYTRTVKIEEVQRAVGCGSSVCPIVTSGGVVDTGTRKIIVTVTWPEESSTKSFSINSYLMRWR